MASLMRIAPLSARGTARISSICIPSCSSSPSTSKVRMMHASPALDPTDHIPAPTMANVEAEAQPGLTGTSNDALVHVKLNYLHPSTKDPMLTPRAGDIKTGRIRAEPHYVPLSKYVFSTMPRRDVLHSAVVYYLDGLRAGTASTKTRGEVAFSGKKILPQKGTGKARRGTRGSPLLRKGGVAHGPKPRDFSTKLNRRVRELALRSALSLRWMQGDLHVVKNLYWQPPPQSCGPLAKLLKAKGWDDALFLTAPREPQPSGVLGKTGKFSAADPIYSEEQEQEHCKEVQDFAIACANIPRTEIVNLADLTLEAHEKAKKKEDKKKPGELHAYEVLARKKLICDLGAIEWLEEKLGGSLFHEGGLERFAVEELRLDNVAEGSEVDTLAGELSESVNLEETAEDVEVRIAEDEAIEKETERVLKDFPGMKDEQTKSY